MLKYKTTSIPEIVHRGVNASEFKKGLTNNTVNKAVSTIGQAIEKEAKDGWVFHSIECLPQKIARKKSIFELLSGFLCLATEFSLICLKKQKKVLNFKFIF